MSTTHVRGETKGEVQKTTKKKTELNENLTPNRQVQTCSQKSNARCCCVDVNKLKYHTTPYKL